MPKNVSTLLQHYGVCLIPSVVRLIPIYIFIENNVRLNTAVWKKVSALFQQSPKKRPPYSNIMVSALLQHIPILKKCPPYSWNLSALLQELGVRLITA